MQRYSAIHCCVERVNGRLCSAGRHLVGVFPLTRGEVRKHFCYLSLWARFVCCERTGVHYQPIRFILCHLPCRKRPQTECTLGWIQAFFNVSTRQKQFCMFIRPRMLLCLGPSNCCQVSPCRANLAARALYIAVDNTAHFRIASVPNYACRKGYPRWTKVICSLPLQRLWWSLCCFGTSSPITQSNHLRGTSTAEKSGGCLMGNEVRRKRLMLTVNNSYLVETQGYALFVLFMVTLLWL